MCLTLHQDPWEEQVGSGRERVSSEHVFECRRVCECVYERVDVGAYKWVGIGVGGWLRAGWGVEQVGGGGRSGTAGVRL